MGAAAGLLEGESADPLGIEDELGGAGAEWLLDLDFPEVLARLLLPEFWGVKRAGRWARAEDILLLEKISKTVIGRSPLPGRKLTVTRSLILSRLGSQKINV